MASLKRAPGKPFSLLSVNFYPGSDLVWFLQMSVVGHRRMPYVKRVFLDLRLKMLF